MSPKPQLKKPDLKIKKEKVNHPDHYGGDTIYEVIKVLEEWKIIDPYVWQAIKYLSRAGKKEGEQELVDLEKAMFYLNRRIQNLKQSPDWENFFTERIVQGL